jgi:hypothetical protein
MNLETQTSDDVVIGGTYRHYKGKLYRVHGVCRHSETLEEMVYYECLYECELGQMWVRPKSLFLGLHEGEPRFICFTG